MTGCGVWREEVGSGARSMLVRWLSFPGSGVPDGT